MKHREKERKMDKTERKRDRESKRKRKWRKVVEVGKLKAKVRWWRRDENRCLLESMWRSGKVDEENKEGRSGGGGHGY